MRKLTVKLTFILGCAFLLAGSAQAGESKSFSVMCVIPAVPGVNTPLASPVQQDAQAAVTITESEQTAAGQTVQTVYDR